MLEPVPYTPRSNKEHVDRAEVAAAWWDGRSNVVIKLKYSGSSLHLACAEADADKLLAWLRREGEEE